MADPTDSGRSKTEPASAMVPNWSIEECHKWWDPGRRLLKAIRRYQFYAAKRGAIATVLRRICFVRYAFWSTVTGAEIGLRCSIGGGFHIPHPNGIVIHPAVVIGPNCLIFQQATIGMIQVNKGAPRLGTHVEVGAGAKILGPISIGDNAKIGANAVVLIDVPANATAVGIPARILQRAAGDLQSG